MAVVVGSSVNVAPTLRAPAPPPKLAPPTFLPCSQLSGLSPSVTFGRYVCQTPSAFPPARCRVAAALAAASRLQGNCPPGFCTAISSRLAAQHPLNSHGAHASAARAHSAPLSTAFM